MSGSRFETTLWKLMAGGLAIATLWNAYSQLDLYRKFTAVRYWNEAVAHGRAISPLALKHLSAGSLEILSRNSCQGRFIKPSVSLVLSELDLIVAAGDEALLTEALDQSYQLAARAVSCLPTNGNLRLRLAMMEHAKSGLEVGTVQQFASSQHYAPAEQAVIQGRISFSLRLDDSTRQRMHDYLSQDAKALCATLQGRWLRPEFSTEKSLVTEVLPQDLQCIH